MNPLLVIAALCLRLIFLIIKLLYYNIQYYIYSISGRRFYCSKIRLGAYLEHFAVMQHLTSITVMSAIVMNSRRQTSATK